MDQLARRTIGIGAVLCSMALFVGPNAEAKHGGKEMSGKDKSKKMIQRLDKAVELTDAQRAQVEQILQEQQGKRQQLMDQMQALRQEKHDKIRAILTPEQQPKFDAWHAKKMKQGHKRGWFGRKGRSEGHS